VSGSPHAPAHHAARWLCPPSRRVWLVVAVLVALTTLPTLAMVFAGRASLESTVAGRSPYRTAAPPDSVIVGGDRTPGGRSGANLRPAFERPLLARRPQPPARSAGDAAGGTAGGGPVEESTCPGSTDASAGSGGAVAGGPAAGLPSDGGQNSGGEQPSSGGSSDGGSDAGSTGDTQPSADADPPPGAQFYDRIYHQLHIRHR
jgi:hypothetical protein